MIRFNNVVKSFGERTILKGVSFEVKEGEILFILGTSGTGKSVLLKNIVGLLRPTSGEIWIGDDEVSQLTEEQYFPVRKICGMVFQHPALFDSLTIFENVAYGLKIQGIKDKTVYNVGGYFRTSKYRYITQDPYLRRALSAMTAIMRGT